MNDIPRVVFSKTMKRADWRHSRVASGNEAEEMARLSWWSYVGSITFEAGTHRRMLKLVSTRSFPAGAVALTYSRV